MKNAKISENKKFRPGPKFRLDLAIVIFFGVLVSNRLVGDIFLVGIIAAVMAVGFYYGIIKLINRILNKTK